MRHRLEAMRDFERGMQRLYALFAQQFQEDRDFWTRLAAEEEGHAELLQELLTSSLWEDQAVGGPSQESLAADHARLQKMISDAQAGRFDSRLKALSMALAFEASATEMHGEELAQAHQNNSLAKAFDQLHDEDSMHLHRLKARKQQLQESSVSS